MKQEKKAVSPYCLHFLPTSLEPQRLSGVSPWSVHFTALLWGPLPVPLHPYWLSILSYLPYPPLPPSACPTEGLSRSVSCLTGIRGTMLRLPIPCYQSIALLQCPHMDTELPPDLGLTNWHSLVTSTTGASMGKHGETLTGLDSRLMRWSGQVKTLQTEGLRKMVSLSDTSHYCLCGQYN